MLYVVILQHPVALYASDLRVSVPSMCNAVHCSFFVFLYWTVHVSGPNWPSSGVQGVTVKLSAAHCNAVLFLLL
jgi:hypothetical protein